MDCKVSGQAYACRTRCDEDPSCGTRGLGGRWPPLGHVLGVGIWLLALTLPTAKSAELVMFEAPFCEWCEIWDDEVGVVYAKTSEGRLAPLRRVAVHDPRPSDLIPIAGVRYSPTFVLLDQGREVGRIVGYPGEDHFWGLLQVLLDKLPRSSGPQTFGDM